MPFERFQRARSPFSLVFAWPAYLVALLLFLATLKRLWNKEARARAAWWRTACRLAAGAGLVVLVYATV